MSGTETLAAMSPGERKLIAYLTSYDNTGEPKPGWNYESTIWGITISFFIASTLCALFRIWVRVSNNLFGWDDAMLVCTRVTGTISSILVVLCTSDGFGEHFLQANMVGFQKKFYVALFCYIISTTLIKVCLLLQYLRIFEAGSGVRRMAYVALIIVSLWGFAFSFMAIFPCFPIYGFWNWEADAKCYGFGSKVSSHLCGTFVGHAASNSCFDVFVLALPSPLYFKENKPWKQRMGVYCLILMGTCVAVVSIWRLDSIVEHQATTWPVMDPTWYGPKNILLAVIEIDLASITASVPIFWPMIQEGFGRIFVTQEVEVVHERLSGDSGPGGDGESHEMVSSDETLGGDLSLKLVRTPEKAVTVPTTTTYEYPNPTAPGKHQSLDLGGSLLTAAKSEFQVTSEGPQGFQREQERHGYANANTHNAANKSNSSFALFDKSSNSRLPQRSESQLALRKDSEDHSVTPLSSSRTFYYDSDRGDGDDGASYHQHSRRPSQSSNGGNAWPYGGGIGGFFGNGRSGSMNSTSHSRKTEGW